MRCTAEFSAGNIPGFVHLYAGEEASGVGVCMHLDDRDAIASTHRGHGHCIAKGCDLDGMMHEIFGRKDGLCGGKGGSMHIADISKGMLGANGIVGAGAPLVCGAALDGEDAEDRRRRRLLLRRRRVEPGRGARELQPRKDLEPADDVRRRGQRLRGIDRLVVVGRRGSQIGRGNGFGIPSREIDGQDFFEVYEAAGEAIERARSGGGPSLLHMKLNRFYGHFEGDAMTYRAPDEVAKARAECRSAATSSAAA